MRISVGRWGWGWAAITAAALGGCGDDDPAGAGGAGGETSTSSGATTTSTGPTGGTSASTGTGGGGGASTGTGGGGGTSTGTGGGGGSSTGTGGGGGSSTGTGGEGGGGGAAACTETASAASRGAALALTPDERTLLVVNRDVGTVSAIDVSRAGGLPTLRARAEVDVGAEPWQIAVDACGRRAFVALRAEGRVVALDGIDGVPRVGAQADVGAEPTALALTPNGERLWVASWVEGTLTALDPATLETIEVVDLNATLAATGLLGDGIEPRAALAHPRSIAVSNDGDDDDDDETVVVTEFFAVRTAPEEDGGGNADVNWSGLVYTVGATGGPAAARLLRPLADTGFSDPSGPSGCFPNQLQSVTVRGSIAWILSICASPRGPVGGGLAKTMTHPVLSAIDLASGQELDASPVGLTGRLDALYDGDLLEPMDPARRMPLVANDLAFDEETGDAWITANGADAAFRLVLDEEDGDVVEIGSGPGRRFVDLGAPALAEELRGLAPIGLVTTRRGALAFVASDVSRTVTVLSTGEEPGIVGLEGRAPRVLATTAPPATEDERAALRGRYAFQTGLGRFSLHGQAWSACQVCHFEGLSDNVTWYFARGPRQSTSLDGSFASDDPTDQRIFNWTAVFDEVADFENVARGLDGGVGAIVHTLSDPPVNGDRVDLASAVLAPPAGAVGLAGSATALMEEESVLSTWADVEVYVQRIRSPKAPRGLDRGLVEAGAALFEGEGGCVGCHGGAKWTLSTLFYEPSGSTNEALRTLAYDGDALAAAGFPEELLPATEGNRFMRSAAGGDQIQCVLRPVGTYGASHPDVNVLELRGDMGSPGQGADPNGHGFNVPSLLGLSVGAPYFHAGNARTLEEALSDLFETHREALADPGFMAGADEADQRAALVAYLLSIDEDRAPLDLPPIGADGGDFCQAP